jgi:hypothetical protein
MIDALSPSLRDSRLFELRLHKILRCFCNDLNVISCDRKRGYKKELSQSDNFFKALLSISPDTITSAGIISCTKENLHRKTNKKRGTKERKESYIIQSPPSSKTPNKIT